MAQRLPGLKASAARNNRAMARENRRAFRGERRMRKRPRLGRRREILAFILALGLPPATAGR